PRSHALMADHPLEVLLRPPVELWAGTVSLAAGVICGMAPSTMMMTPSVGYTSAAILAGLGAYRINQGAQVLRYQRNLKRLPRFAMSSSQIPCYRGHLYLGQGFKWGQKHTQRLKDTLSPSARRYVEPSKLYASIRAFERRVEGSAFNAIAKLTSKDHSFNPFRPLPPIGGNPALHAVELKEEEVLLPMSERVGHTLVLGTTRVGKTRL